MGSMISGLSSFIASKKFVRILFVGLFFFFGFHKIIFFDAYSFHEWRQSDSLSITYNFYESDNSILEPELHCYISDDFTSGKSAGEFPILYYLMGLIWKLMGPHTFIYRLLVLALNVTGFVCLFKVLKDYLSSATWPWVITIAFFCCPVLLYYGVGFITNVPAFSCVLIGWYFFYFFLKNRSRKLLFLAFMFFTLGGLLKITAFISGITIFGFLVLEAILKKRFDWKEMAISLSSFVILYAWYGVYVSIYTDLHHGKYTFNDFWPIWEMGSEQVQKATAFFFDFSMNQVMSVPLWILFLIGIVVVFLNAKILGKGFLYIVAVVTIGVALYLMGWYQALLHHDYYLINLIILPLIVVVGLVKVVEERWPQIESSYWLNGIKISLVGFSLIYGANNLRLRYPDELSHWEYGARVFNSEHQVGVLDWLCNHSRAKQMREMSLALGCLGVEKNDLVIVGSDPSFCIELFALKRKGWSAMSVDGMHERVQKMIEKGAKYLFLSDKNHWEDEFWKPYTQNQITEINGVRLYQL